MEGGKTCGQTESSLGEEEVNEAPSYPREPNEKIGGAGLEMSSQGPWPETIQWLPTMVVVEEGIGHRQLNSTNGRPSLTGAEEGKAGCSQ